VKYFNRKKLGLNRMVLRVFAYYISIFFLAVSALHREDLIAL